MRIHWKSFWRGLNRRAYLLGVVVGLGVIVGYMLSQQPKIWCDRQWAGIALYKGGYRSWTLTFCDGFQRIDGKWQRVTITTNSIRKGYHWPTYRHADLKRLGIAPPP